MSKSKVIYMILLGIIFNVNAAYSFGLDLDEMYRDIIKSENAGTLPNYSYNKVVKEKRENKKALEEQENEKIKVPPRKDVPQSLITNEVPENAQSLANSESDKKWQDVVKAVQKGNPSPFDIEEIENKVERNDKEAIEMLAWIKANGVGCEQDLSKAWALYNLGAQLGIKDAVQNANAVYRAMNRYQKDTLPPF